MQQNFGRRFYFITLITNIWSRCIVQQWLLIFPKQTYLSRLYFPQKRRSNLYLLLLDSRERQRLYKLDPVSRLEVPLSRRLLTHARPLQNRHFLELFAALIGMRLPQKPPKRRRLIRTGLVKIDTRAVVLIDLFQQFRRIFFPTQILVVKRQLDWAAKPTTCSDLLTLAAWRVVVMLLQFKAGDATALLPWHHAWGGLDCVFTIFSSLYNEFFERLQVLLSGNGTTAPEFRRIVIWFIVGRF